MMIAQRIKENLSAVRQIEGTEIWRRSFYYYDNSLEQDVT